MKILVVFASHRMNGKNKEIEEAMSQQNVFFDLDFVHLANNKIEGCTSCHKCGQTGYCILPESNNDNFQKIFDKMKYADAIFIISPVYASIPSRLSALFERLTSILFNSGLINTDKNPLLNKKTAIFSYCSSGICDESNIKVIFDKFVMKNYRFDYSTYKYLNSMVHPQEHYHDITDYIMDTLKKLT